MMAAEFSPDRRYRYVLRWRCTPQLQRPAKELEATEPSEKEPSSG